MADYSDETLRSLIRQLIKEDVANTAQGPEALANRMAAAYLQAIKLLKVLLTPGGFAAAVAMGLVFEKEFTMSLLDFTISEGEAGLEAVKAFNNTDGRIFAKMAAFSATFGDETAKNKYAWLDYLAEIKDESIPADIVDKMLNSAVTDYKIMSQEDADNTTPRDKAIIAAVISDTPPIESIFTEDDFINDGKTFRPKNVQMNVADLKSAKTTAENEGRYLDAAIYEGLIAAQKAANKRNTAVATAEINNAKRLYQGCIEIKNEKERPTTKLTIFDSLEEIEGGIKSNFERNLDDITDLAKDELKDQWKDVIDFTTDQVFEKLKDTPLEMWVKKSDSSTP